MQDRWAQHMKSPLPLWFPLPVLRERVRVRVLSRLLVAAVTAIAIGGCERKQGGSSTPAATSATAPAPTGVWPAFHGGGPLLGVAAPIGTRPLSVRWTFKAGGSDSAPVNG